jgi:hypothetical protein
MSEPSDAHTSRNVGGLNVQMCKALPHLFKNLKRFSCAFFINIIIYMIEHFVSYIKKMKLKPIVID